MAYDNPQTITYSWDTVDFGDTTDVATSFQGPVGKRGEIVDVFVVASEVFNAPTTEAVVEVGIAAGGADYVNFGLGTTAATDTAQASDTSGDIVLRALPADTQIEVTFVAVTGTSPTGIANIHIVVDWY